MLILISILTIIVTVVFLILGCRSRSSGYVDFSNWDGAAIVSGIIFGILIFLICFLATKVSTAHILDEKIAMYQEENAIIEQDIARIVNEYLKHEQDTFTDLKKEKA